MNEAFRLSRIRSPRGTVGSIILLAVVFILFGVIMAFAAPEQSADAPRYFDGTALTFASWLLG